MYNEAEVIFLGVEITVFTPTFNRAYTLGKLYNSLKNQTCKDFEWLVIDDGSSDNTKELFSEWTKGKGDFPIRYYYKNNGGKHRAINYGLERANGRLFFIVDSDDYVIEDAIETILNEEKKIEKNKYNLAGLGFNKGRDEHTIVGDTFSGESLIASSIDRRKYNIKGDKAEVFYTQILKKYKFPEFPGENFITESVVWFKIADDGYKIKWINKIIYICEYLDNGLTKNSINLALNNYMGYTYSIRQSLKYDLSIKEKMVLIGVYTRVGREKKDSYYKISKNIDQNILICMFMEFAFWMSRLIKFIMGKFRK